MENLCLLKTKKKMNRQVMHCEKNFAKCLFVKGFVSGIYKDDYIWLMKTQITQFQQWVKDLERLVSKEDK